MDQNHKIQPDAFANYLQSMVKLEELEKMTEVLDEELLESQRQLSEIIGIFNTIPRVQEAANGGLRHEDLSNFLEAAVPKLLMPDMTESSIEVDIDNIIATMKGYAEDLKKNFVLTQPQPREASRNMDLDLEGYATSLDQLSKRLANIKLNKSEEVASRNQDLEAKLAQLCQDVNMFTQMVQAKTTLSQTNSNWLKTQDNNDNTLLAHHYDNIINKLVSGINEVTLLLQNKN